MKLTISDILSLFELAAILNEACNLNAEPRGFIDMEMLAHFIHKGNEEKVLRLATLLINFATTMDRLKDMQVSLETTLK